MPHQYLREHRLMNGLQIVGHLMPDYESVALGYYVRTGARDEDDPAIAGISHFLEHMVFKGTSTRNWQQLKREFSAIGAEKNGYTSVEHTIYYLRVLAEYLDHAVELLSDMIYPRLAESDFETEKGVIINEIARSEDQPQGYLRRRMMHIYFSDHPLAHYVLGSRESIQNLRLEQMHDYWQHHYVANNIILVAAGRFDWEHLVSLAERYCASWPAGQVKRLLTSYEPRQSLNEIIVNTGLKQQFIMLAMPSVAETDPNRNAAVLGSDILGDPYGSRLYWNIHQQGLAESAWNVLWTFQDTGVLYLFTVMTQEAPVF